MGDRWGFVVWGTGAFAALGIAVAYVLGRPRGKHRKARSTASTDDQHRSGPTMQTRHGLTGTNQPDTRITPPQMPEQRHRSDGESGPE